MAIMIMPCEVQSPYARGEADGFAGEPGPAFPRPTSTWAEKLYNRGWEAGISKRVQAVINGQPIEVRP